MSNLISIAQPGALIGASQPPTLLPPEVEKGVGCDFDSYLLVPDNTLDDRIAAVRAQVGPTGKVVCALSGGVDSSVAAALRSMPSTE